MEQALYIHIPFCKAKCLYCDFYSIVPETRGIAAAYVKSLLKQIKAINCPLKTIYIGGGTPTVLGFKLLESLLEGLKGFLRPGLEFTVEANPESLDAQKIALLKDKGVNRLSIGAQSFDDNKLKGLGRIHTAKQARQAIERSYKKGFRDISCDLIFGFYNESLNSWQEELAQAVSLPITHISCYSLTYEKKACLFSLLKKKKIAPLDEEICGRMYQIAIDYLRKKGFKQYEVSSFAKQGYISRHNYNYWQNNPYIGLGPSAASYVDGIRSVNVSDTLEYIKRFKADKSLIAFKEKLSAIDSARETAALKIRTNEGINYRGFKKKTGFDFLGLERAREAGLLSDGLIKYVKSARENIGIKLTRKGFLFCDRASSALV